MYMCTVYLELFVQMISTLIVLQRKMAFSVYIVIYTA